MVLVYCTVLREYAEDRTTAALERGSRTCLRRRCDEGGEVRRDRQARFVIGAGRTGGQ